MPSALLQDLTKAKKNGGNFTVIIHMDIDTDGKFIDRTTVDCFGCPAKTGHVLGSQTESDFKRQTDGSRVLNITIAEQDLLRQNMLELICPSANSSGDNDELRMEDDTAKVGSSGNSFNSSNPVFSVFHFMAEKKMFRHAFIQFKPEGGHDGQKAKQWNLIKLSAFTIEARGSDAPDLPADDVFDGFTIEALVAPFGHGKVFEKA
jgi:hypothetical protein